MNGSSRGSRSEETRRLLSHALVCSATLAPAVATREASAALLAMSRMGTRISSEEAATAWMAALTPIDAVLTTLAWADVSSEPADSCAAVAES